MGDIMGRVVVVHDRSGTRVACGVAKSDAAQPGDQGEAVCAGYSEAQANTDIQGYHLASIWAPSSAHCCSLCDERSDCAGYVFHFEQCHLKKNATSDECSWLPQGCGLHARFM